MGRSECNFANPHNVKFCVHCGIDLSGSTETAALNEKERCIQNIDSLTEFVTLDIMDERQ